MKKGFTLVELLAVIFIIGLISSLVLLNINDEGDKLKKLSYDQFENLVETATNSYITKDDTLVDYLKQGNFITKPAGDNVDISRYTESYKVEVTFDDLIDGKYLSKDNMINPKTNNEIDIQKSYVKVIYRNYKYIYDIIIDDKDVN